MPWRGLIRVDTGIFTSIRKEISLVLNQGENEINLMGRRGSLEAERIGARSVSPERWNARNAMPLDPKALEPQPPVRQVQAAATATSQPTEWTHSAAMRSTGGRWSYVQLLE
jgi:hypothetical protein